MTAVEAAQDGTIYVVERCVDNSCEGRSEPPILKYNAQGKLLKAWGEGMFNFPHGGALDPQGNLWVTDARGANGKGHQAIKFDPDGKVLMTLGKAGVSGSGPDLFDQPTDVVVAPNGDIFVTDSHRNGKNNRVVRFSKDGKFIKEWGSKGSGPGQISEPHTIAMDSQGRLFVGDRENNRIQIFDADGQFLRIWPALHSVDSIYIRDGMLYAGAGLDHRILKLDLSGQILGSWGPEKALGYPHGICVDANRTVYVAEVGADRASKFLMVGAAKRAVASR